MNTEIRWEIRHGDKVTAQACQLAAQLALEGMDRVTAITDETYETHAEHDAVAGTFHVEVADSYTAQYVERALENLIRVALGGIVVRVETSIVPVATNA